MRLTPVTTPSGEHVTPTQVPEQGFLPGTHVDSASGLPICAFASSRGVSYHSWGLGGGCKCGGDNKSRGGLRGEGGRPGRAGGAGIGRKGVGGGEWRNGSSGGEVGGFGGGGLRQVGGWC